MESSHVFQSFRLFQLSTLLLSRPAKAQDSHQNLATRNLIYIIHVFQSFRLFQLSTLLLSRPAKAQDSHQNLATRNLIYIIQIDKSRLTYRSS